MSNYVPTDLLIEILQKLPVKSLIRFAAVSKSWRSIITSAAFIASHLSKVLPHPTINPEDAYISVLGFGVDAGRTHHKVVRFLYCRNAAGIFTTRVEIFSLKTWSWRRLIGGVDITLDAYPSLYFRQVFLNGVVHWLIEQKPIGDNSFRRSYILAFDVGDEVFREVMLPEWEAGGSGFAKLRIFVIKESLGVVKSTGESCDVWVMKEYCVKESWTKLYTVRLFEKIKNVVAF
ncbi:PREDICTED: F-box protein CPR30-like [Erythranthe guttata]|uniref:F-box protein CPR30-like n=1 Tax=Erythranthe guttata TaxID=4155 RepID=UPI00064DE27C|nr:PREDICTED: F-box protein CPR30-like [Erythranthe guttata]|eukprot:XP_012852397.1 PREDICTED: F-box protein CPR30-like [Erythranthe guttata]